MSPYIRTVRTASGATAVQVVYAEKRGSKKMEHIGSAYSQEDLAALKLRAQQLLDGNQGVLDLGIDTTPAGTGSESSPVPITSERAGHLIDAIHGAYAELGFDQATDNDRIFKDLVTARIVHPGSKLESIETLAEIGLASASHRTMQRHLPDYATTGFRDELTRACARHAGIGPGVLVLYDVTTLYLETDEGDDFRKPGFPRNAAWNLKTHRRTAVRRVRDSHCRSAPAGQHGRNRHDVADDQAVSGSPRPR